MTAHNCRFCDAPLKHRFVDLGSTPLANAYLTEEQLNKPEPSYPLRAFVCSECWLVQADAFVPPEDIFSHYAYFSSYSDGWVEHARQFTLMARKRFGLSEASQVIEVASNDGYLLKHFVEAGVPVLGIEPAENVAEVARQIGVPTEARFFGKETAADLVSRGLAANIVIGNNVLAHVPDINDFVGGLSAVLKPDGVVSVEFPHLLRLMENIQFDTVYHEHFYYLSLLAVERCSRRTASRSLTWKNCRPMAGVSACLPAVQHPRLTQPAAALPRSAPMRQPPASTRSRPTRPSRAAWRRSRMACSPSSRKPNAAARRSPPMALPPRATRC